MKNNKEILVRLIKESADYGTLKAEEIHTLAADMVIAKLEESGVDSDILNKVKSYQDTTIVSIYDLVRTINHRTCKLAVDILRITDDSSNG